jgi:hypothetical protein
MVLFGTEQRLEEIKRTGTIWIDHLSYCRSQGHGVRLGDPTLAKLMQMPLVDQVPFLSSRRMDRARCKGAQK